MLVHDTEGALEAHNVTIILFLKGTLVTFVGIALFLEASYLEIAFYF